jgi:hypothetical protein
MANENRCRCPRCTIRGLMGPAVIVTIGVLFLLQQARGDVFDFSNTYPFILIVIGAVMLASSLAPMTGHVDSTMTPPPSVPTSSVPPANVPPAGPAQNSVPGRGQ